MTCERVLVLEDSDDLRTIVADMISAHGFVPVAVESAETALESAAGERPALAIVDQNLPGASGARFVRLMRASSDERLRTMPVIGVSRRPWSERELIDAGACCFIRKPIDVHELVRAIRWALEVYRPHL
jgi:DNA-binding response OmpR family regulator